ncbi:hypothetical protein IJJ36_02550 [Candidatus Saccharibacteria bacterium]|nr:hypothetical protein [Candidatus Saccharibacteria bacterium]MBR3263739.1 hypothetical protein [Candidatus Saccharibacteria bacterium]
MVFNLSEVTGIGDFTSKKEKKRELFLKDDRVFLVINKNTIEVRTDDELARLLKEKYESVMESRYFGRGGIEIVLANQLKTDELCDLVRLSYNLS